MEPIELNLVEDKDNCFGISAGNNQIKTPGGKFLISPNKKLIETTIYDLQKYDEIEIEEDDSISGDPLDNISLYALISTQIDFWNNKRIVTKEEFDITQDPFLNLSPGPEKREQLRQWKPIIEILKNNNFDFYKLQYYSDENQQKEELKEKICSDFNNCSNWNKSVFINLVTLYRSLIGSWCFCFNELSEDAFAACLKFSADFQSTIDYEVSEEISKIEEDKDTNIDNDFIKKLRNNKTQEWFNRYIEVFNTCKKFIEINDYQLIKDSKNPLLQIINKGESKYIEFKESLSLDVRQSQNNKSYQPKKESYIELSVLKTIAGFLNSDGGELFIGVDDQSNVLGIKNELDLLHKSSKDKIQLHLKTLIKENIGSSFNNFINAELKQLNDQEIIHVTCDKSDKEVFIKGEDFYVRSGPSNVILKRERITRLYEK